MNSAPEQQLSPIKQALLEIRTMRARLDEVERAKTEPIAIVGMGLRFPGGASNPQAFWRLLREGRDGIIEVPELRWSSDEYYDPDPDAPNKMYVRQGGFLLEDISQFDPTFFGISPREAQSLDPQQRLLLEVSWEALENGGLAPDKVYGSRTGVFIGIGGLPDYLLHIYKAGVEMDAYMGPGATYSAAAGRLSYFYGLKGPAVALDTACSSSLVAVHLACQSLRNGESEMALVGGVTIHINPESYINQCKLGMTSPDGYSKAFDASGNGVGRGEGCSVVVLKRLEDAVAAGDNILAVIRGSAVNQDGRTAGLTAPNGPSQQTVLRAALANARVAPHQVAYLEAHGTGTPLGDPIEIQAAAAVYGEERSPERPLLTGSVKTNIGHLEEGAGLASLIKVVLMLQNEQIPPSLHFREPNPNIHWDKLPVQVNTRLRAWPRSEEERIAAISGFGWSGTNAHIVVAEAPVPAAKPQTGERSYQLLTLSARSEQALRELAEGYGDYLAQATGAFPDVCFTANTGRAAFAHRLGVVAASAEEAEKRLRAYLAGQGGPGIVAGQVSGGDRLDVAFLFTGQGSQYVGMGRQLYDTQPVFREAIDRCAGLLEPYLDQPLLSLLYPADGQSPIDQTAYTQPALFALEYALAQLWMSWGISPAVVMGHSVGEYVAACVAGVFSLEDGLRLIAERGRLMQTLPEGGVMAAVFAGEEVVKKAIAAYAGEVSIAAINGPEIVVISGMKAAVHEVIEALRAQAIRAWPLAVSHALHTGSMQPILDQFEALAATVTYAEPRIKMISLLTGARVGKGEVTQPAYWRRHMRDAVRFADAMASLYEQGYRVYLEIGPNPNLLGMGQLCVPEGEGAWIPSLRQKRDEWQQLMESVGLLFVEGVTVNWTQLEQAAAGARRRVSLPTYPFQRQRYWIEKRGKQPQTTAPTTTAPELSLPALLSEGLAGRLQQRLEQEEAFSDEQVAIVPRLLDVISRHFEEEALAASVRQWYYTTEWRQQEAEGTGSGQQRQAGSWLIFADPDGIGHSLAAELEEHGEQCHLVLPGARFEQMERTQWEIDPTRNEDYERLLEQLGEEELPLAGVVHLWSQQHSSEQPLTARRLQEQQALSLGSTLLLVQALARRQSVARSPRLWLVTRGAQPAGAAAGLQVDQAPLWGLGNVIRMEQPELNPVLIDLDPSPSAAGSSRLFEEIWAGDQENGVAFRDGERYVARLVPAEVERPAPLLLREDATYLITGGMGALGLLVARWLAANGARHLVLLGRSAPSDEAQQVIGSLEEAGCRLLVVQADVSQAEAVAEALAQIELSLPPLRGIIHTAGTLDDGILLQQEWARFARVLAAKVEGTWNLHSLTLDLPLDFFILFSSVAALFGAPGQGNYAAANSFLDAIAYYRRAQGRPAISINWPGWKEAGMAAGALQAARRWESLGLGQIEPEQGLQVLAQLLAQPLPQVAVLPVDWSRFLSNLLVGQPLPFLNDVGEANDHLLAGSRSAKTASSELLERLQAAPAGERRLLLRRDLGEQAIQVLGLDPSFTIDPEMPLMELGLDSLMAVQLRNAVSARLGRDLPATLLFNYPTLNALSDTLLQQLLPDLAAAPEKALLTATRPVSENEAIAIVGMACRFPGAASVESFWQLLQDGVDAIREVPGDRWEMAAYYDPVPGIPGKMYTRWGGFLEKVDHFDAPFFGISPREAIEMDPQQRLLLEVSWEALEQGGISPERLHGSQTGVFVGIGTHDYSQLQLKLISADKIGSYSGTGNSFSVAAGRLSYVLGLQGPSMAVDTACSSSLVALHLACQSLRSGESDAALAGGVNLILSPEATLSLSQARMMAEDGRCKAFAAAANGFVRSEGCGVVVLKRLSDALADGDNVLAVIRGSAINQDGRSQGLTAPNGVSQERVIRRALQNAGVHASQIGYVEAHGTGTALGDPIEVGALAATYGAARPSAQPLLLGSVKTNVGHMETAAGVGGLIKVVLALQNNRIPAHLHFHEPSPYIPWEESAIEVTASGREWARGDKPRLAGLSSFGFSGTNVHVIIEEGPVQEVQPAPVERPLHLLTLSARNESALKELAGRYEQALAAADLNLAYLCYTANSGRSHFEQRLALVAEDTATLRQQLAAFGAGRPADGLITGDAAGSQAQPRLAFLFTGQGAQYVGMGRTLYETQPAFRAAIDQCDRLLQPYLDRSLLSVLYPEDGQSPIDQTAYTQPALFALEYALAQLWQSWGIRPAAVMGHSVGEYVAACVAGVFSLEDGLRLIAGRGRLMQALPQGGAMAAVFASEQVVAEAITAYREQVSIAAVNGQNHVVISGTATAVQAIVDELQQARVKARPLTVSHAFHSPLMEPMLEAFEDLAAGVTYHPPQITLISNVTGRAIGGAELLDAAYWSEHVRRPVRFAEAMETLAAQGYRHFLEIGPDATLSALGRRCLKGEEAVWLASLRPALDEWVQLLDTLGRLYVHQVPVDWAAFEQDYLPARRRLSLPTYPFQRNRYWVEADGSGGQRRTRFAYAGEGSHPLLGLRWPSPLDTVQYEARLTSYSPSFLMHRQLNGRLLLPQVACLESALAAGTDLFQTVGLVIEDMVFEETALALGDEPRAVQMLLNPSGPSASSFQLFAESLPAAASPAWKLLASGTLRPEPTPRAVQAVALAEIQSRCRAAAVDLFYERLEEQGLVYGQHLQLIDELWQGEGEMLALLHLPDDLESYRLHPILLDTCCQIIGGGRVVLAPQQAAQTLVLRPATKTLWCHARLQAAGEGRWLADLDLLDGEGQMVAQLAGLRLSALASEQKGRQLPGMDQWLYEVSWRPEAPLQPSPQAAGDRASWLILADGSGLGQALADRLQAAGQGVRVLQNGPGERLRLPAVVAAMVRDGAQPLQDVINLWAVDLPPLPQADAAAIEEEQLSSLGSSLWLLQSLSSALAEAKPAHMPRLWLVTRGAQPVAEGDAVAPTQSPLWGLGRTMALEQPKLFGGLIDLDPEGGADEVALLLGEIAGNEREQQVAFRQGKRYVARLVPSDSLPGEGLPVRLRPDGAYLISGGRGGLGLLVAEWLVEHGARRLILLGRTPLPPRQQWSGTDPGSRQGQQIVAIRRLEALGAHVHLLSVDVADETQLVPALAAYADEGWPPIRGVIHAAGVVQDSSLLQLEQEALLEVLRPKVTGGWLLHHSLQEAPLDFFVMFSSAASLVGSAGQANYAAANAFLEGLAHFRRQRGQPALSINWGPWAAVGMAAQTELEGRRQRLAAFAIPPREGLDILGRLLTTQTTQIGVLPVPLDQWPRLSPPDNRFFEQLVGIETQTQPDHKSEGMVGQRIYEAQPELRRGLMVEYLRRAIGHSLLMDPATVQLDRNMMELGLDSIMIMELIQQLDRELELSLFPREIFERPSVNGLAEYLLAEVERVQRAQPGSAATLVTGDGPADAEGVDSLMPLVSEPNPPAVFLLSSPRAGSTLLRVMLAGHPLLFSPPELHLLAFRTMAERHGEIGHSYLSEGLQRAVMEALGVDSEKSKALLAQAVAEGHSVQEVYRWLQEAVAPRLLVDKSPSYATEISFLQRAEKLFDRPRYIHLVRHPYATIHSIARNRLDKLYRFEEPDPFRAAEQLWATLNGNILDFMEEIEPGRHLRVFYESLVTDPEKVMKEVCAFLGIPFDPALLLPYEGGRMKDEKMAVGDPDFFKFQAIDANRALAWRQAALPRRLGGFARRVAGELEYELPWPLEPASPARPAAPSQPLAIRPVAPNGPTPLSFGQERLLFMDLFEEGKATYNLPIVLHLSGALQPAALEQSLQTIVQRHLVLRTNFVMEDGQIRQEIVADARVPWEIVDLASLPQAQRDARRRQLAESAIRQPFSLSDDVKLRAKLLLLAEDEHQLILTLHHIAGDGWSTGILLRELMVLYEAYAGGHPSPLPDLPVQYADYASWQRQWVETEEAGRSMAYWKEKLAGLPVLELPADHPRPAVQSYRGDRLPAAIGRDVTETLRRLCRQEGVTLFMALLAGFQVLLHRYTGLEDITVGSPVAGRNRPETRDLLGFFVNNLVLRSDLSGNPTFRQLLAQVRQTALEAYEHQDVPFDILLQQLQPERNLSHAPLFQVMFALQNMPMPSAQLNGLGITRLADLYTGTAMFDLFVPLWETEEGLSGHVEYNTDLFQPETIRRMMGHLEQLLAAAAADPEQRIQALPLLTAPERHRLLVEWNQTEIAYPAEKCLHELFEAQAAETPEAIALTFEEETLTYRQLNERANRLAHHLQQLGVTVETLVGLYLERSPQMVVAVLGVLKAGGAYVPLDPAFPEERLSYMMADSAAPVLLTEQSLQGRLETGAAVKTLYLDGDWEIIMQASRANPATPVAAHNLAYVIYTSGSTGRPKGVQLEQRGVVNFLAAMRRQPGLSPADVLLSVTTLSFDISVLEIFLPLTTGARLALVSRATAGDGLQLAAELQRSGATVMQATPSTWRLLIDSGWQGTPGLKALCGGEALPRDLADQLLERVDSLWNMYGPTETTIWSTTLQVEPGEGPISIGRPIGNTSCYILDTALQPVPVGVPGQLFIGGHGLARGYLNRPELTAENFVPHPFTPGERVYRTGDVARYRVDGTIEFLGRLDHQVKLRGFRIELGEIEAALGQHPAVETAVVVLREDVPGDKRLVAYAHCGEDKLPAVGELRRFLGETLPDYMIPSHFVQVETLPLTPNGKINRRALPAPEIGRPELDTAYVAAADGIEATIAGLWQEALKIEQVGVEDNFFDLGGHSMLLAQVHSKLQKQLGTNLPIVKLFQYPTIRALAGFLSEQNGTSSGREEILERAQLQKAALARRKQREARRISR